MRRRRVRAAAREHGARLVASRPRGARRRRDSVAHRARDADAPVSRRRHRSLRLRAHRGDGRSRRSRRSAPRACTRSAIPEQGIGFAVKVDDGAQRAQFPAVIRVLQMLDVLPATLPPRLEEFLRRPVRNTRGEVVGEIRLVCLTRRVDCASLIRRAVNDDADRRDRRDVASTRRRDALARSPVRGHHRGRARLTIRDAMSDARDAIPAVWVEELLLQTYLFAGFPRALNAMREWRRVHPEPSAVDVRRRDRRRSGGADGERPARRCTARCTSKLRENIRALHPRARRLDDHRRLRQGICRVRGSTLPRRELCIVAACAASKQDRQLHSHLHGALNVGVAAVHRRSTHADRRRIADLLGRRARAQSVRLLWARVRGEVTSGSCSSIA